MIAFASIWFAITRQRWKDMNTVTAVGVAAVVCVGLIAPFFLPYLQMQESTGFERPLSGQYSANVGAWLVSSAWAHRWWAPYLWSTERSVVPGHPRDRPRLSGALRSCDERDGRRRLRARRGRGYYVGLAVFTFWLTLGPKAGLYTLLYYTVPVFSFLRAPSRAGIVVTLCLVVLAAPALIVLMRRRAVNAAFAILLVLVVADLYRAPLRMREAPPLPHAYRDARAAAEGAGDRVAVLV